MLKQNANAEVRGYVKRPVLRMFMACNETNEERPLGRPDANGELPSAYIRGTPR